MVIPPVGTLLLRVVRAAVVPVVLVVLTALPGLVVGRIYAGSLLAALVAGAALASVAVSVAARRLPSWTVAPLSVLLLAGYTLVALRTAADRAALTDPLPAMAGDALRNGIPRLLTAMIPVEPTPDTVVIAVVAAWLAGLAGAELAVRANRVLLGCVPAAALFAGALYVVGPNADTAGWPALVFAALVAVALAVSARPAGRPAPGDGAGLADVPAATRAAIRGRALAGAAAGVAVVVALIALVGPWIGGRVAATPVDPRRYVQPPQVDRLDESPLNRISGWALNPDQRLFDVSGGGAKRQRLRLAVLPDYDGVTWRIGATYRNAGRVLPTQPALPDAQVEQVRQDITVDELTGRLLPAVPTPTGVQGARVAYDVATGTLISPERLRPGTRYTVTSARQIPDLALLPSADVPSGDEVARYLALGAGVPEQIQRLAEQLADGNGAAYDRADAIEEFLGTHYREVADAPSGHAYPNLSFFLFGSRDGGGQRGTSEQFAASFALLARLTGLPTRIVVGFDAPAVGTVTGANASAWPEVLFDDLGWVAFDPMPQSDEEPRPVEEDFTAKPSEPPPTSDAPPPSDLPSASAATTVLADAPADGPGPAVIAGSASGGVLVVVGVAALAVILLRRSLRRRRLADGPPDARIAGAWLEFTDALRLAGQPASADLAATEVATLAAHPTPAGRLRRSTPPTAPTAPATPSPSSATPGVGGTDLAEPVVDPPLPPVDDLVAGINASAFAPGAVDAGQAERAGAQAVAYADALRSRRSWWRRILWSVHPGPLRWHRDRR